eukprot:699478-Rhodomonas_salina.2
MTSARVTRNGLLTGEEAAGGAQEHAASARETAAPVLAARLVAPADDLRRARAACRHGRVDVHGHVG